VVLSFNWHTATDENGQGTIRSPWLYALQKQEICAAKPTQKLGWTDAGAEAYGDFN
jgi:hypothetical protein